MGGFFRGIWDQGGSPHRRWDHGAWVDTKDGAEGQLPPSWFSALWLQGLRLICPSTIEDQAKSVLGWEISKGPWSLSAGLV